MVSGCDKWRVHMLNFGRLYKSLIMMQNQERGLKAHENWTCGQGNNLGCDDAVIALWIGNRVSTVHLFHFLRKTLSLQDLQCANQHQSTVL